MNTDNTIEYMTMILDSYRRGGKIERRPKVSLSDDGDVFWSDVEETNHLFDFENFEYRPTPSTADNLDETIQMLSDSKRPADKKILELLKELKDLRVKLDNQSVLTPQGKSPYNTYIGYSFPDYDDPCRNCPNKGNLFCHCILPTLRGFQNSTRYYVPSSYVVRTTTISN